MENFCDVRHVVAAGGLGFGKFQQVERKIIGSDPMMGPAVFTDYWRGGLL